MLRLNANKANQGRSFSSRDRTKPVSYFFATSAWTKLVETKGVHMYGPVKAGVHLNLSEILVSLKRGWKGKKGL